MSFFKNRTVVGVICILLSLLICFGVTPLFNQSVSQKAEIVRVTKEIKAGDEITKDMVQTVEVGGFGLPDNVIRQSETVVGKYAKADLSVGDYILNTKLSDIPASENAYLYNLDGTKQALSVTIKSFANGLSGKLQSGDIVSVIAPDYKKQGMTVIPAELKYVEVISVTASSGYDANTGDQRDAGANSSSASDNRELPATVTLLVSPEQSKALAELEADGKLHLSLVYRGTPANTAKFIEAQDKVIAALYPTEPVPDSSSEPKSQEPEAGTAPETPAESGVR
jgi:pilus assembly protein CpaB